MSCFLSESSTWQPCPRCSLVVHCVAALAPLSTTPTNAATAAPPPASVDVVCACRHAFCWHCRRPAHRPLPCAAISKWEMARSELEEPQVATPNP